MDFNFSDDITMDQITNLRKKLKEVEKSIKEKNKPKTITISGKSHESIKKYCSQLNLKIGDWVEETLKKEMFDNLAVSIDNGSDEDHIKDQCDKLVDKYKDHNKVDWAIKSNSYIFITGFKFLGYYEADGLPAYKYIGNDWENDKMKIGDLTIIKNTEFISKMIIASDALDIITRIAGHTTSTILSYQSKNITI